eukprot:m.894962 g.894962  ORF g.894962 m.894962 type:complete len:58 (+) comp59990_c0_seq4:2186-2359(+)
MACCVLSSFPVTNQSPASTHLNATPTCDDCSCTPSCSALAVLLLILCVIVFVRVHSK